MAYEKQTWECGETITAEKLNHIENGIADASSGGGGGTSEPFVLEKVSEESSIRFNKTFGEIKEAFNSGKSIWVLDAIFEEGNMYAPIDAIGIGIAPNGGGSVVVGNANYIADTDQDYPSKGR